MPMLSEDDLNLKELTDEELDRAWDLWFDLAQSTNEWDPLYSHGVLVDLHACSTQMTSAGLRKVAGDCAARGSTGSRESDGDPPLPRSGT